MAHDPKETVSAILKQHLSKDEWDIIYDRAIFDALVWGILGFTGHDFTDDVDSFSINVIDIVDSCFAKHNIPSVVDDDSGYRAELYEQLIEFLSPGKELQSEFVSRISAIEAELATLRKSLKPYDYSKKKSIKLKQIIDDVPENVIQAMYAMLIYFQLDYSRIVLKTNQFSDKIISKNKRNSSDFCIFSEFFKLLELWELDDYIDELQSSKLTNRFVKWLHCDPENYSGRVFDRLRELFGGQAK